MQKKLNARFIIHVKIRDRQKAPALLLRGDTGCDSIHRATTTSHSPPSPPPEQVAGNRVAVRTAVVRPPSSSQQWYTAGEQRAAGQA
ncbi:hypothetical protein E2562_034878 [Oryza meyeriana var. granulata]|uniref:Uncharacterized protein n=1 Tax=Oryza meyeriana var. granulata TaxID=110450 RepID=A0A6G1C2A1_9ORYZ|nr:hypothetical protein E2562_034878 [Oryza meyeriana var. granulata]